MPIVTTPWEATSVPVGRDTTAAASGASGRHQFMFQVFLLYFVQSNRCNKLPKSFTVFALYVCIMVLRFFGKYPAMDVCISLRSSERQHLKTAKHYFVKKTGANVTISPYTIGLHEQTNMGQGLQTIWVVLPYKRLKYSALNSTLVIACHYFILF